MLALLALSSTATSPRPARRLLLELYDAEASSGVALLPGPVTKRGMLFETGAEFMDGKRPRDPSAPWSGGGLFSSVLPPRNGRKVWRAYYDSGFCPPSVPAAKCLQGMGGDGVLYAESTDGLSGWTVGEAGRPWDGSSRSNIVYTCPAGNALYENDQTKEVVVFISKSDQPWSRAASSASRT